MRKRKGSLASSPTLRLLNPTSSEGGVETTPPPRKRRSSGTSLLPSPHPPAASAPTDPLQPNQGSLVDVEIEGPNSDSAFQDPFLDAILLSHISTTLCASLTKVAPFLDGRGGVYDADFFHNVVGLCNRGLPVSWVGKAYDLDILRYWVPHLRFKYRLPLSNCSDPAMATLFVDHHYAIYGGPLDNGSFSMKYLRAAWATFKERKEINWIAEALKRREQRIANGSSNPKKLGPPALRQQVVALINLLVAHEPGPTELANGGKLEPTDLGILVMCSL
jgi:hypothetical protein